MAGASSLIVRRDGLLAARRLVADLLEEAGVEPVVVQHAELLAGELLANVHRHTRSGAEVTVQTTGSRVRISVADSSGDGPVVRPLDPGRVGGNGLRIVAHVATAWGTTVEGADGKAVWFTLDRAGSGPGGHADGPGSQM